MKITHRRDLKKRLKKSDKCCCLIVYYDLYNHNGKFNIILQERNMNNNQQLLESEFLLYQSDSGNIKIDVFLKDENIWLTQKRMSELFGVNIPAISKHLNNIYEEGELTQISTISKMEIVQQEGIRNVKRKVEFYNLDAIIAVGYRVNSKRATQFRIWATKILKEFIIKGFALDDERLKQGEQAFGKNYFKELLERVRSIRASERKIYQQITDIFAEICIDYDKNSDITKNFYGFVQNKFHFAITGQTAAEIIHSKADRKLPYMGLQNFKNSPNGRVLPSDVTIAKNYLNEKEIKKLERTISGFFDYIENVIENKTPQKMEDMAETVDKFLNFNEFRILEGKGKISKKQADAKAMGEYAEFNKTQKIESDFDKSLQNLLALRKGNLS